MGDEKRSDCKQKFMSGDSKGTGMNEKSIKTLLIEDNPGDVRLIREMLKEDQAIRFDIVHKDRLSEGLHYLDENDVNVVILDLGLPDSIGLETFTQFYEKNIQLPIIVLTGNDDDQLALKAVQSGAQDYLVKGQITGQLLSRSIQYAIERKQAEENLSRATQHLTAHVDNSPLAVVEFDSQLHVIRWSKEAERVFGWTSEEVVGRSIPEIRWVYEEDEELVRRESAGLISGEQSRSLNVNRNYRKDGSVIYCEWYNSGIYDSRGKLISVLSQVLDITNRRNIEEALRESEANYRQLFDNAPTAIYQIDFRTGKFLKANAVLCEYLGCSQKEITSLTPYDIMTKESQKLFLERLNKMALGDKVSADPEYEIIDKNGKRRWMQLNSKNIYDSEGLAGADVVAHDITDRKRYEEALRASEERHRTIIQTAMDGFWVTDMQGRLLEVNEAYCRMSGYSAQELLAMRISRLDAAETEDHTAAHIQKVIAQGEDRFEARHRRKDETLYDVEVSVQYRSAQDGRLVVFLHDITERKLADKQLQDTLESLRKAVGATVQVMVSAVETRDPYTAGHQIRSADLARAIATEMGLPQEKIDGIRMAGSIHDIGKLSIPAEILSKPKKLTEIEFSLIKEHSQKGYEMLKDVESPWPLAQIVYQHHERMDGSGYPRNLKGDDILMEARILAVSDVVESMASHRPYRPALGIEAALEEIENNKGKLYDADAVAACLRLFREKVYQLEGTSF
jgi:PAS domain S-box-containing protein